MAKFFKVDTCYQGETFPEFINLDNVDRIAVGPNIYYSLVELEKTSW